MTRADPSGLALEVHGPNYAIDRRPYSSDESGDTARDLIIDGLTAVGGDG